MSYPYNQTPPDDVGYRPVRRRTLPKAYVTYTMLVITVIVFIFQMLSQLVFKTDIPALYGAKVNQLILAGQVWRLITPLWLHGGFLHIAFNMYALYVLGVGLEHYYGPWRFLVLYLVSGFAGNVFSFLFSANPSYGASTAIFGLVAAQGIFIYQNRRLFPNYRQMINSVLFIIAINLVLGFSSSGIDNWGHLGGLAGGLALAWFGGPKYDVVSTYGSYQTQNVRPQTQTWIAAAAVFVVFALLAYTKFLAS